MEHERPSAPKSARLDQAERLLAEHGRDIGSGRVRIAAGRSGIAVGFPRDPMLHVSWWVLVAIAVWSGVRLGRKLAGND